MDGLSLSAWTSDFGHLPSIGRLGDFFDLVVKADLGMCRASSLESEFVWRAFDLAREHQGVNRLSF